MIPATPFVQPDALAECPVLCTSSFAQSLNASLSEQSFLHAPKHILHKLSTDPANASTLSHFSLQALTQISFISSLVKRVVSTTRPKIHDAFQEMASLSSAAQLSSMCIRDKTLTWTESNILPSNTRKEDAGGTATSLTRQLGRTLKIGQSVKNAPPCTSPIKLGKRASLGGNGPQVEEEGATSSDPKRHKCNGWTS
jgi:hypothetical protein